MTRRVVVVGGGISGLAAARAAVETASAAGEGLEVVLLERDPAVGGKAQTRRNGGWLVEGGPAGYLDDPETAATMRRLIDAAGLGSEVITASEAAKHRFVVRAGRAREVKPNPARMVTGGILSLAGAVRLLAEPFIRPRREAGDESVFDFASRRIGREAAERLVAPMMLGIFAGDARKLSLLGGFPRLAALEREHGSLVRGMLARRRSKGAGGPSGPAGVLTSFREGMQSLPRALAQRGGFAVRTPVSVEAIERGRDARWALRSPAADGNLEADAVVLAAEAWSAARLLSPHVERAGRALGEIDYPPVIAVSLGYRSAAAGGFPRGFGCLIPRGEAHRSLGCVWDSTLFDGRAPEGCVLVRVLLGGAVDPAVSALSDQDAVIVARDDLGRLFGVDAEPVRTHVVRWARAIPQYDVGHPARVAAISEEVAGLGGIFLAGNALHGIAFAKAAAEGWRQGEAAARSVLQASRSSTASPTRTRPGSATLA